MANTLDDFINTMRTELNKKNVVNQEKADAFMEKFSKVDIMRRAMKDKEHPYGVVLTWLRDYFDMPKSTAGATADYILKQYEIEQEF